MATTLPLVRVFPADFSALGEVRRFVCERSFDAALPERVTDDLLVAVTEAAREMLVHELSSVLLVAWWTHDGVVEIWLTDEGDVEPVALIEKKEEGEDVGGGLAFPYILGFVDEVDVRPGNPDHPGTMVRLVKQLRAA